MEKAPICENCKKEYPSCGIFAIIPDMNVCSEHEPLPRIIKVKNLKDRVETGPTQFNDDWPGLFIRGDHSFHFALQLEHLRQRIEKKEEPGFLEISALEDLISLFKSTKA